MREARNSRMPWLILGNICLMAFTTWAPTFCVPPMEHILKEELLLTHAQTSLLFTGPALMLAAVGLLGGSLADRIGAKKAIGMGAIIMVIGSTLRGTATSASSLLGFTFIYGAGLGLSFPNLPKMVSGWVSHEKTGMALGMYSAAMFAGEAVAVAITISLIFPITGSFQGVFLIWSVPLIAATILWWAVVKEPPRLSIEGELESRAGIPLRQVLRNRNLWLLASLFLMLCFFYNIWVGWSPALLMLKGATPDLAGIITSITLWVGIPGALFIPRLSYRVGLRKPFLSAGMIALAISAWVAIKASVPLSWPLMVVSGLALNSMIPIIFAIPLELIPSGSVGTASGLVISVGNIGAVIGPLVGGRILDLTGNLYLSLIILIAVSVAATGVAFRLPETGPKASHK
jgi:cyanate permease